MILYLMEFEFKIWMLENPKFKIPPLNSSSKHNIIVNQKKKKKNQYWKFPNYNFELNPISESLMQTFSPFFFLYFFIF